MNIKKFDKYQEYLEVVEKMVLDYDAKSIFEKREEDTKEIIIKYFEKIKKDPIILSIENNCKNALKLDKEQQKEFRKIYEYIYKTLEEDDRDVIKYFEKSKKEKDKEVFPFSNEGEILDFIQNIVDLRKLKEINYKDIVNLWGRDYDREYFTKFSIDYQKYKNDLLNIIFNEKEKEIYKSYLEIKDLFEYGIDDNEVYSLDLSANKKIC